MTTFTPEELKNLIMDSVSEALRELSLVKSESDKFELMSVTEASEFLNLERQTIYGFTSKRLIPFCKRGKRLYFSKKDLHAWVLEGKRKTHAEIGQIADDYIQRKNQERNKFRS